MGLTIHYSLATRLTDPSSIRTLVETLRPHAQDLPFQAVGELVEFEGGDCPFDREQHDDPHKWFKIQAGEYLEVGRTHYHVDPIHIIGFSTWPGEGSEPANFGFCRYPSSIVVDDGGKAPLTITAKTNTKTYDGTTSAAAIPTVSGLKNTDTATGLVEQYNDKAVGTGKTLLVTSFIINDGNSGHNYTVATVDNNTGVINPGAASKLVFTTQPPSQVTKNQQFKVVGQVTDSFGNPVNQSGKQVSIVLSLDGILNGTTTVNTNASGQAVFGNLSVSKSGRFTLTIKANNLTKGVSNPFQVGGTQVQGKSRQSTSVNGLESGSGIEWFRLRSKPGRTPAQLDATALAELALLIQGQPV